VKSGSRPESWRLSPLIVNDLTLDDRFKDHPFITTHPSLRFYATMPIRTRSGFNIGAISVMHDWPREGLNDVEVGFLDDIAIAIMAYLETTTVKDAHRRSENMVKGLGVFVEGRSFLREWWLDTKINKAWGPQDSKDAAEAQRSMKRKSEPDSDSTSAPTEHTSARDTVQADVPVPIEPQDKPPPPSSKPPVDTTHQADSKQNMKPFAANLQETMLSANLKDMFSRASNVIRECIEVDGTVFLDASVGTFGDYTGPRRSQGSALLDGERVRRTTPTGDFETPELSVDSSDSGRPSATTKTEGHGERQKMCGVLSLSVSETSGLEEDRASKFHVSLTERVLQSLLRKYPRGQVFDLREGGSLRPSKRSIFQIADVAKTGSKPEKSRRPRGSSKQRDAKAILQMLPGARSVVFSPLWDSHRARWFAGSFVWTTRPTRVLTRTADLNYLVAFGNSIMAEVARLDAIAADQAKSDFISSISHELRTPLHGILASVDFLQETTLDSFQKNMIDTIEQCGTTLLDTIQHILDFAKINNFTKSRKKGTVEEPTGEGSQPRSMGLRVDIDLSVVTEDVIDSVYAGHEFRNKSSGEVANEAGGFPFEGLESASKKEGLEVIMDIDWRPNWVFDTQSGALRRILMNLIGNSLKYTDAGWVKISLQSIDVKPTASQSPQSVITITVSDSGRGMSQEFLHGHIFTPFVQENPMNPGTGLGLSIVQQIVRSLGGTIDVKSKQGIGTEVKVSLTLAQVLPKLPMNIKYESLVSKAREKTSGLTLGLVGFGIQANTSKIPTGVLGVASESSLYLRSSLEGMATVWFDMKVTASATWKDSPPEIYVTNEYRISTPTPTILTCEEHLNSTVHSAELRLLYSAPVCPCTATTPGERARPLNTRIIGLCTMFLNRQC
jgi:signal transduction histidine kinase